MKNYTSIKTNFIGFFPGKLNPNNTKLIIGKISINYDKIVEIKDYILFENKLPIPAFRIKYNNNKIIIIKKQDFDFSKYNVN